MATFPCLAKIMFLRSIYETPTQRQWRKIKKSNASRRKSCRRRLRLRHTGVVLIGIAFALTVSFKFDQAAIIDWPDDYAWSPEDQLPKSIQGGNAWNSGGSTETTSRNGNWAGRVTYVRDGDTIEVSSRPIRFENIDCAEIG